MSREPYSQPSHGQALCMFLETYMFGEDHTLHKTQSSLQRELVASTCIVAQCRTQTQQDPLLECGHLRNNLRGNVSLYPTATGTFYSSLGTGAVWNVVRCCTPCQSCRTQHLDPAQLLLEYNVRGRCARHFFYSRHNLACTCVALPAVVVSIR